MPVEFRNGQTAEPRVGEEREREREETGVPMPRMAEGMLLWTLVELLGGGALLLFVALASLIFVEAYRRRFNNPYVFSLILSLDLLFFQSLKYIQFGLFDDLLFTVMLKVGRHSKIRILSSR